jgi:hypothetical protein
MQPVPEPTPDGRQIKCPECERRWPRKAHARYALHYRVMHTSRVS